MTNKENLDYNNVVESVATIDDLHNLMMLCSILIRKAQTPVTYEDVIAIKQIYAEFETSHI